MDFKNIKVPFIKKLSIEVAAEEFRQKFWDKTIPIDIEKIIDVKLKINVIPIPGLEKICNTNTLIASSWESIYIDKDLFEDERRQNRLRFSLAHEIGHYILHKDIYQNFNIDSIGDFYNFLNLIPSEQYGYLETQAQKFASFLLVPRDILRIEFEKIYKKVKNINNLDKNLVKSYISTPLAKKFGISADAMEIILGDLNK